MLYPVLFNSAPHWAVPQTTAHWDGAQAFGLLGLGLAVAAAAALRLPPLAAESPAAMVDNAQRLATTLQGGSGLPRMSGRLIQGVWTG